MIRRIYLLLAGLYVCLSVFAQQKPLNVLVLYSDDQRYNTIHALGNKEIFTPNLDRLVNTGVAFTRAHTMGGMHGALCAPSRAMLHTAQYLHSLEKKGDFIPPTHIMMPEYLQTLGYKTYGIGKWHNDKAAFNRAYQDGGGIYFGGMHFPKDGGQESPRYVEYDATGKYDVPFQHAEKFSSEFYADHAIAFLNRQQEENQPFFCYVAFTSPHDPRTPPQKFRDMYPWQNVSLPPNFLAEHPFDNGDLKVRDEVLLPRPLTEEMARKELALYYGMISELDDQIGRILDALEKNGQRENTLIVFAGDNGLAVGSHGLLGKQNIYEHSMRVPMIFSHPSLPQNQQRNQLCYLADIFPTVMDILQVNVPEGLQSTSLFPYIQKPGEKGRKAIYYAYRDIQRGVRTEDNWKLIRYNVNGTETTQLFDLNTDPFETKNLAGERRFEKKHKKLEKLLTDQMQFYRDFLDIRKPNWGKTQP